SAVSFSSEPATRRFPSSRCASTIQIVFPSRSTADTQPKLHPAFLRSSAIISQCFTSSWIRFRRLPPCIVQIFFGSRHVALKDFHEHTFANSRRSDQCIWTVTFTLFG